MKIKFALVVAALCSQLYFAQFLKAAANREEDFAAQTRIKRQSQSNGRKPPLASDSFSASSKAVAMSSSSSMASTGNFGGDREGAPFAIASDEGATNTNEGDMAAPLQLPVNEPTRKQAKRPNRNRKPATGRRPAPQVRPDDSRRDDYYEEEEDCDNYDSLSSQQLDYGSEMIVRPMRQFSRLMGDMFNQMHGMTSGDYGPFQGGSNVAVSSSYSNEDGNSRVSSIVNKNGRTRGIVSETRNGNTKTRRIGDYSDDENWD